MEKSQNLIWRHKILLGLLLVLLILALPVAISLSRLGKIPVDLLLGPPTASLTIDSKPVKAASKIYISPGDHTFKASQDGFEPQEKKLSIHNSQTVVLVLTPQTDAAKSIANDYQDIYLESERLSGAEVQSEGEDFRKANLIVAELPYRSLYFNIDYRLADNDKNRAIIQITADTTTGRAFALEQIRKWGYDPTDYQVEFVNYTNPFGGSQ